MNLSATHFHISAAIICT